MDETKICENCKHYREHYYWYDGGLNIAYSGHCTKHRRTRLVFCKNYCEKWEPAENKHFPTDEAFEVILRRAAKQIRDIVAILKIRNNGE